jgi:hypothetical protein
MGKTFRYEPPRLVDMRGADLCGQFISCRSGSSAVGGESCQEYTRCYTGDGAERCDAGSGACGCDSCCQNGNSYVTTAGVPWVNGCECYSGGQAYMTCSEGQWTGGMCWSGGYAGADYCNGGESVIYSYENCYSGA